MKATILVPDVPGHRDTVAVLARRFGGCTVSKCSGVWCPPDGRPPAYDDLVKLECAISDEQDFGDLCTFCSDFARQFSQECIYFETSGATDARRNGCWLTYPDTTTERIG